MYIYIYIYIFIRMYVCMYVCIYIYIRMYVCMYVCMYISMYVCPYLIVQAASKKDRYIEAFWHLGTSKECSRWLGAKSIGAGNQHCWQGFQIVNFNRGGFGRRGCKEKEKEREREGAREKERKREREREQRQASFVDSGKAATSTCGHLLQLKGRTCLVSWKWLHAPRKRNLPDNWYLPISSLFKKVKPSFKGHEPTSATFFLPATADSHQIQQIHYSIHASPVPQAVLQGQAWAARKVLGLLSKIRTNNPQMCWSKEHLCVCTSPLLRPGVQHTKPRARPVTQQLYQCPLCPRSQCHRWWLVQGPPIKKHVPSFSPNFRSSCPFE